MVVAVGDYVISTISSFVLSFIFFAQEKYFSSSSFLRRCPSGEDSRALQSPGGGQEDGRRRHALLDALLRAEDS